MVEVQNRRKKIKNIEKDYPNAIIIDVTSKGNFPMVKFSPFYPFGKIPIPFSPNKFSQSVEGIWQGLKVFEKNDIDELKEISKIKTLILLDYETNGEIENPKKPLSHAQLIKMRLEENF